MRLYLLAVLLSSGCPNVATANMTGAIPHCGDPGAAPCPAGEVNQNYDAEDDLQKQLQKVVDACRSSRDPSARAIWVTLQVKTGGGVKDDVGVRGSEEAPVVDAAVATCVRESAKKLRTEQRVASSFSMEYAAIDHRPNERARAALEAAVQSSMKACTFVSPLVVVEFQVDDNARPSSIVVSEQVPPEPKTCIERELGQFSLGVDRLRTKATETISGVP